jgi:spoIIIJ-associated protein
MGNHPSVDRGQQWLSQLLQLASLEATVGAEIKESLREHSCWLEINDSELADEQVDALIGDRGRMIDAIQYLANATLNLGVPEADQGAYTVDLAGYREERHQALEALAEQAIEQIQATGRECEIPGLSSAERRQLHHWIEQGGVEADGQAFSTFSRGQEPDRRLVVCLKGNEEVEA